MPRPKSEPPPVRDMSEMQSEIERIQHETGASLDRAIAEAAAASQLASTTLEKLNEQGEKTEGVRWQLRKADETLEQTDYNLKYGLNWKGALASTFHRKKKAGNSKAETPSSPARPPTMAPIASTTSEPDHQAQKKGLFRKTPKAPPPDSRGVPKSAPDGFETRLDTLDALVEGLAAQSAAMNKELVAQSNDFDGLNTAAVGTDTKVKAQATFMAQRFKLKR